MTKIFRNLFCFLVLVGALGKEVVQRYYSSPAPNPSLGRTVATFGTNGGTIYVTPQTDFFSWISIALAAVTLGGWMFWPAKIPVTEVRPLGSVSRPTVAKTLTYYWQRKKRGRYGFTVIAVALASYIWITEHGQRNWTARIVFLLIALWSFQMLIDYRTRIDTEAGIFEREKLLFGRYRIGALSLPLNEFSAVVLDRYHDSEDNRDTFYACLKHRTHGLKQVCYFETRSGQRREDAEITAREIAATTGLQYEEVV